jgi:hypothetical protein
MNAYAKILHLEAQASDPNANPWRAARAADEAARLRAEHGDPIDPDDPDDVPDFDDVPEGDEPCDGETAWLEACQEDERW